MNETITFADVLIKPKFSMIESRRDVDLSFNRVGFPYVSLPIISANMDTISESNMCIAMARGGGIGCLHRFWNIQKNVDEFKAVFQDAGYQAMCSVGLGTNELERSEALVNAGCTALIVDVANGAQMSVVNQVKKMRDLFGYNTSITAGNFATGESVQTFIDHCGYIEGVKIGIGPGSICKTRLVTGVGIPQLSAILDVKNTLHGTGIAIISDGGVSNSGDCAKALGAGAHLIMSGSLFSGTDETPGEAFSPSDCLKFDPKNAFKKYRGSASKESYEAQGKTERHRAEEGESILVRYKGPVENVLQEIEGGLRSSLTYTNSKNLEEFRKNVEFVRVSSNTLVENGIRNGVK